MLLFIFYMSMNYTFPLCSNWVFLYLIQERHFSSLESSWLAMAVCAFMNTGGNLGDIIGIPIVTYLSRLHVWNTAFFVGVVFAVVSALAWLRIFVEETAAEPRIAVEAAGG